MRLIFVLLSLFLLTASRAFAHRPYEHRIGELRRDDGQTVSIFECYVDGIIMSDPVSIQFRLPNGTNIASTAYTADAVVRGGASIAEVYQFNSFLVPVANRVQRFDGYSLSDGMTSPKRLLSPLFHLISHWGYYAMLLGVAMFLAATGYFLSSSPKEGGWLWIRAFGYFGLVVITPIYLLFTLVFVLMGPVSFTILVLLFLFAGVCSYPLWKRFGAAGRTKVAASLFPD
jgi:hypothetical protein